MDQLKALADSPGQSKIIFRVEATPSSACVRCLRRESGMARTISIRVSARQRPHWVDRPQCYVEMEATKPEVSCAVKYAF